MENRIVTFSFANLNSLTKTYPILKIGELENLLKSKFKDLSESKIFSVNERTLSNDITQNQSFDVNLNSILDKLFNYHFEKSVLSTFFPPYIPSIECEFGDLVGNGAFGKLRKCKLKIENNPNFTYAFKYFDELKMDSVTFNKEVSAYSKLRHKSIPKFIGVSFDSTMKQGFIIDYIEGSDLMKNINTIEDKDKLEYAYQLADVISYLHENGCVHRDLKPDNIMIKNRQLSDKPQLYLVDYGLSKFIKDDESFKSHMQSMPSNNNVQNYVYRDPKQKLLIEETSADVWSLGCIIYFLYAKKHPCNNNLDELKNLLNNNLPFFKKDEINDEFIFQILKDCCDYSLDHRKSALYVRDKILKKLIGGAGDFKGFLFFKI